MEMRHGRQSSLWGLILCFTFFAYSCGDSPSTDTDDGPPSDSESDKPAIADTATAGNDADTDTDTDTDTDSDVDTDTDADTDADTDTDADADTDTDTDADSDTDADTDSDSDTDVGDCITCNFMAEDTVRIGGSFEDETASAAPFDVRYLYLAGEIPTDDSCSACNDACGNWWGCWQYFGDPPGQYPLNLVDKAESAVWQAAARPQIPMVTYYIQLHNSGAAEGTDQVGALDDASKLTPYFNDWRFLLETVSDHVIWLHVEPDLWGYVRAVNDNPHLVPAKVKAANPEDCADEEDSASGFARCMIKMVRKYAPKAKVGLHASAWLIGLDGDGVTTGAFMNALGADLGDFIVTDLSDRDAGYYELVRGEDRWWDDADAERFMDWSRDVAETTCRPIVMWQIPLGNMGLDNTDYHFKDNRVDWLFAEMDKVAAAHTVALLFGAGADLQTTPETDGGNFIDKTVAYRQSGGEPLCP